MLKKAIAGTFAVATAALVAGCPMLNNLIPPLKVPLPEQSAKFSEVWSGATDVHGQEVAIPAIPTESGTYVKIPANTTGEGFKVDVPAQAKSQLDKINKATIEMTVNNANPTPLTAQIFLAKEKPFSAASVGTVTVPAAGEGTGSITLDTALLKEAKLELGVGFSSAGTGGSKVKIDKDGKITIKPTLVVELKLL